MVYDGDMLKIYPRTKVLPNITKKDKKKKKVSPEKSKSITNLKL